MQGVPCGFSVSLDSPAAIGKKRKDLLLLKVFTRKIDCTFSEYQHISMIPLRASCEAGGLWLLVKRSDLRE